LRLISEKEIAVAHILAVREALAACDAVFRCESIREMEHAHVQMGFNPGTKRRLSDNTRSARPI
jgi:hypothetical protein